MDNYSVWLTNSAIKYTLALKKLSGCKSNEEKKQTNGKLHAILN